MSLPCVVGEGNEATIGNEPKPRCRFIREEPCVTAVALRVENVRNNSNRERRREWRRNVEGGMKEDMQRGMHDEDVF
jgi:hypothetical protein